MLPFIVNSDSNTALRLIGRTVSETYLFCNKLVEVSAAIRNETYLHHVAMHKAEEFRQRYNSASDVLDIVGGDGQR